MSSEFLDANALRAATFIRHVEVHEELGSTNDRAIELARDACIQLPALIVARRQTAGRGRGSNTWWAADGALTFSVLLDAIGTGVQPEQWPQLSLATAVAVCDALTKQLPTNQRAGSPPPAGLEDEPALSHPQSTLGIKWPNDVYANGRKICGILIESPGGSSPANNRVVIGIGINVNNTCRHAPPKHGINGIALCELTEALLDLQRVLSEVLNDLKARIEQLRAGAPQLVAAWQQCNLLRGRSVSFESEGRLVEGKCVDIAADGALVIDTATGRARRYSGSVIVAE